MSLSPSFHHAHRRSLQLSRSRQDGISKSFSYLILLLAFLLALGWSSAIPRCGPIQLVPRWNNVLMCSASSHRSISPPSLPPNRRHPPLPPPRPHHAAPPSPGRTSVSPCLCKLEQSDSDRDTDMPSIGDPTSAASAQETSLRALHARHEVDWVGEGTSGRVTRPNYREAILGQAVGREMKTPCTKCAGGNGKFSTSVNCLSETAANQSRCRVVLLVAAGNSSAADRLLLFEHARHVGT